jgi:protein SCO1/2
MAMFWKHVARVTLVLMAISFAGCKPQPSVPPAAGAGDTNRQTFEVKGELKEIKPNGRTAVIKHEEIPDYMPAMTMDLDVKDPRELSGLKPGDAIAFRMVVTSDDGWIENVRKLASVAPTNAGQSISIESTNGTNAGPLTFRRSPMVEPLEVGDAIPDYKFTNHLGAPISLAQFRGGALGLTFIFTRCPFPTFCPRMNQNFQKAERQLKARNGTTNWMLLSISFDPAWDTPARMKQYSTPYVSDPARWQFATSDMWTIDGITEQFGMTFYRDTPTSLPNHNLRTVVIDARGRVQKVFTGNEWTPEEFVEEMVKAASVK